MSCCNSKQILRIRHLKPLRNLQLAQDINYCHLFDKNICVYVTLYIYSNIPLIIIGLSLWNYFSILQELFFYIQLQLLMYLHFFAGFVCHIVYNSYVMYFHLRLQVSTVYAREPTTATLPLQISYKYITDGNKPCLLTINPLSVNEGSHDTITNQHLNSNPLNATLRRHNIQVGNAYCYSVLVILKT